MLSSVDCLQLKIIVSPPQKKMWNSLNNTIRNVDTENLYQN